MWSAIEAYYQHALSGLVATSEVSGYPVANILDRVDGTVWKATSSATQYITYDAGVGNTYTADYFACGNHNLNTVGATIVLQWSTDNFSASINDAFTAFAPGNDKAFVKKFASLAKRYWRIKISGASAAPFLGVSMWGAGTTLDYADSGLDPYEEDIKASVNVGDSGFLQGVHIKYTERRMSIRFEAADDTLYQKVKALRDAVGLGLFFIGWEPTDHSTDLYMMRMMNGKFDAPLLHGGVYRSIAMDLIGRKEE